MEHGIPEQPALIAKGQAIVMDCLLKPSNLMSCTTGSTRSKR